MDQYKILIVEDDQDISEVIKQYLKKHGYLCQQLFTGGIAVKEVRDFFPDLIILDIQLPDSSGFDICKKIRHETDVPILFLSGLGEEHDKIKGLRSGGDDYMTKPFSLAELLARIQAILRRSNLPKTATAVKQTLEFPGLQIDLDHSRVILNGNILDLSPIEFQLLLRLARNPGWIYTAEQLFTLVWGEVGIDTRTVAVHINRLRKKMNQDENRSYILTVWRRGYKFNEEL